MKKEKSLKQIYPEMGVVVGVISVSFAAIFVRFTEAPPLVVAFYRLLISVPFFAILALLKHRKEFKKIDKRTYIYCGLAGVFLAAHFVTWFTSLRYTSVASSLVLVTCHPIIIIIASRWLFKEKQSAKAIIGVGIAFIGCVIISGGDYAFEGLAIYGDILAFLGALFMALYILTGRKVRKNISAITYIFLIYLSCLVTLSIGVLITKPPLTGYGTIDIMSFIGLAIICHSIGHGLFNWALAYVSPTFVSTTIIGEVAGSVVLAAIILKEIPTQWQVVGGIVTIIGIVYYNRAYYISGQKK